MTRCSLTPSNTCTFLNKTRSAGASAEGSGRAAVGAASFLAAAGTLAELDPEAFDPVGEAAAQATSSKTSGTRNVRGSRCEFMCSELYALRGQMFNRCENPPARLLYQGGPSSGSPRLLAASTLPQVKCTADRMLFPCLIDVKHTLKRPRRTPREGGEVQAGRIQSAPRLN